MRHIILYEAWNYPFGEFFGRKNKEEKEPDVEVPEFVQDWEDEEEIFDIRTNFYKILTFLINNKKNINPSDSEYHVNFINKQEKFTLSYAYGETRKNRSHGESLYYMEMKLSGPRDFDDLKINDPDSELVSLFYEVRKISNDKLKEEEERKKIRGYKKYFGDI